MPELSPYCATFQQLIEIRMPDLDEPVTAKCVLRLGGRPATSRLVVYDRRPAHHHGGNTLQQLTRPPERIARNLPIDLVHGNPKQPRKVFNLEKLQELSQSILKNGLGQPITVVRARSDLYAPRRQSVRAERRSF